MTACGARFIMKKIKLKKENAMKTIGKEVAFLKTGEGNPRNGEGTFARLNDGSILHVYTQYYGESWIDEATARLAAVRSFDEGESWSDPYVILQNDKGARNYMSPSLLRLPNGKLGMFFLRKEVSEIGEVGVGGERILCMPVFVYSEDEGETWSNYVYCTDKLGYYCGINDGILLQRSGRIMMPTSTYPDGTVVTFCSDDCGTTWYELDTKLKSPFYGFENGLEEPGIYEHENGELWIYARTVFGHQYQSRSADNGKTWSPVIPNLYFTSPNSPMRIKKIKDLTVAIFNPTGCTCTRDDYSVRGSIRRTPFVCAVSRDDGMSFNDLSGFEKGKKMMKFRGSAFLLESSLDDTYCYPSIIETKDGFLVAYYHSGGGTYTLASTKISKVYFDEIN